MCCERYGLEIERATGGAATGRIKDGTEGDALLEITDDAAIYRICRVTEQHRAERGVVQRFGRHVETVGDGLGWRLPWPIETVTKVNVEANSTTSSTPRVLTAESTMVELNLGVQYRIKFAYPGDTSFAGTVNKPQDVASELNTDVEPGRAYHFNYDYAQRKRGPTWLVPTTVYDDRRFTYIRMGDRTRFPSGNFPVVFARDSEEGEEFVVNSTVQEDTIVVHGTYPYLVIRHGDNVVGLRRSPER